MLKKKYVALCSVAVVVGACKDLSEPTAPRAAVANTTEIPRALQAHSRGIEDVFLKIEQTVPGFGGFFTDSDGNVNVYVRDPVYRAAALAAVTAWLQLHTDRLQGIKPAGVIARAGQFVFSELVAWQGQMFDNAVEADEIGLVDADESRNRVRILVKTNSGLARVAQLASRLGIPQNALVVEVAEVDVRMTTADVRTSTFRPMPGGVQIRRPLDQFNSEVCTQGFAVRVNGVERFLTASHCTGNFTGGAINQSWSNPTDPGNTFGYIVLNPAWTTTGCGPGASYCRETDAALGAYFSGVNGDFKVAETSSIGTGSGSGNTTVGNYWSVADWRGDYRQMGDTVYKTGRTSGTTKGPVVSTCTFTTPDPVYHAAIYCAHIARMNDQPGDSGAPVYYLRVPLAPDWRYPEGLAFGSAFIDGQIHMLYNSWDQLQTDLGVLLDPHHL